MKPQLAALLSGAFIAPGGATFAHHSFAMFDAAHPTEISGTVKEFNFVIPHVMLIVEVKGQNGVSKKWVLEGRAPGLLVRDGMTAKSLQPGDEITATINPLRNGGQGGSFEATQIKFKNGRLVVPPK
jgi:hypothetical protein